MISPLLNNVVIIFWVIPRNGWASSVLTTVIPTGPAASEGAPYLDVEKARALFNNETGEKVVTFMDTMFRNNWTAVDLGSNPFYFGVVLGGIFGPWEINQARNLFPDVFDHITIVPPPVPDDYPEDKPIYTFADTKGLVMFATTKHREAAWKFIKWVYSDIEKDRKWMEFTNLPPAREDLLTNQIGRASCRERVFRTV